MKQGRIRKKTPLRSNEPKKGIIRAIGKYMISNPGAKDTEEGVKNWWLEENFSKEEVIDIIISALKVRKFIS